MKIKILVVAIIGLMMLSTINVIAQRDNHYKTELRVRQRIWDEDSETWVEDIDAEIGDTLTFKINVKYIIADDINQPYSYLYVTDIHVKEIFFSGLEYIGNAKITYNDEVYYGESQVDGNSVMWHITDDYGIILFDRQSFTIEFTAEVLDYGGHTSHSKSVGYETCNNDHIFGYDYSMIYVAPDMTPPVTSCELLGIEGFDNWFLSDVEVVLTAHDAESEVFLIRYKLDDGLWNDEFGDTVNFSVTDEGEHTISFFAYDEYGNKESMKTRDFNIDKTKPESVFEIKGTMGENRWYVESVTVDLFASDELSGVKSIFYKINDQRYQLYRDSIELTENGIFNIEFYSTDIAGNVEDPKNLSIKIDKEAPKTTAILPATKEYYNGVPVYRLPITVILDAKDNPSGVKSTYYKLTRNNFQIDLWEEYIDPFVVSQSGFYTLEYYSIDNAGNIENIKTKEFIKV